MYLGGLLNHIHTAVHSHRWHSDTPLHDSPLTKFSHSPFDGSFFFFFHQFCLALPLQMVLLKMTLHISPEWRRSQSHHWHAETRAWTEKPLWLGILNFYAQPIKKILNSLILYNLANKTLFTVSHFLAITLFLEFAFETLHRLAAPLPGWEWPLWSIGFRGNSFSPEIRKFGTVMSSKSEMIKN